MLINTWKGLAMIAIVASLVAGGAGVYACTAHDDASLGDEITSEPEIQVTELEENGTSVLDVRVGVRVEGRPVAIQGAHVEVLSVDTLRENDTITVTFEKVADGETDEEGAISFELESGKYLVVATYDGLTGLGKCNLEEDVDVGILMHNISMDCNSLRKNIMHAFQHMEKMTIQIELE